MAGDRVTCACEHLEFEARVEVGRLTEGEGGKVTSFSADVRITCTDCGKPFLFVGVPFGLSPNQPTVSVDGQELRCPIIPQGTTPRWVTQTQLD